jgi:hypothetical protein
MGRSIRRTTWVQSLAHHQGMGDTRLTTMGQSSVHPAHDTPQTRRPHPVAEILCNIHSRTARGCTSRHLHRGKAHSSGTRTLSHRDTQRTINAGAPQRLTTETNRWTFRTGNQQEMMMAGHACHPQNTEVVTNARRSRNVVRTKHHRRSSTEPHKRKT